MKHFIFIIVVLSALTASAQITNIAPITSDYNVTVTNNTNGRNGWANTITCSSGTCTVNVRYGKNLSLNWAVGDSITIAASNNNGDAIIDPSLLGTVTLATVNNAAFNYTYSSSSTSSYTANNHDYEIPYQECDQNGNLWQVMRKAVAGGAYNPDTINLRIAKNYPGCSGGATTSPVWGPVTAPLFQWTDPSCTTPTDGPADIRNFAFGKIVHGGTTTFTLLWMSVNNSTTLWCGAYYAYIDNPDANNPLTGWSSTTNGPSGRPGTPLASFSFNGVGTYYPNGTYGRLFCTKLDCSQVGTIVLAGLNDATHCCAGNVPSFIFVTADGHTWTPRAQISTASIAGLSTNEATAALLQDNDHLLGFVREYNTTSGACVSHFCRLYLFYTSNFTAATPTWTIQDSKIPNDPRNTATGSQMPSPELICHVLGSQCWLTYENRIGYSSVNQESLKSLIFDPAQFTSLDFSGATPQNIYDSVMVNALAGYFEPFISTDGKDIALWGHDYNWYQPSGPLNFFQVTAKFPVVQGALIASGVKWAAGAVIGGTGVAQPIYGGPGQPGATTATLSGNTVVLNDSAHSVLPQLQATPEAIGQSWSVSTNNQAIYLILFGGGHSFIDANTGLAFAFNPATAVTVGGVSMFMYQSTNALYGAYKPKVVS